MLGAKAVQTTDGMLVCQSLKRITLASSEDLSQCPGFGATKVRRIKDVFSQPFRVGETRTGRERRAERQRLEGGASEATSSARGRFIQDDEEQQTVLEMEATQPTLPSEAAATSVRNPPDPTEDGDDGESDEVEDAGEEHCQLLTVRALIARTASPAQTNGISWTE